MIIEKEIAASLTLLAMTRHSRGRDCHGVKTLRNDSVEFTAMTTYCHSEERGKAP